MLKSLVRTIALAPLVGLGAILTGYGRLLRGLSSSFNGVAENQLAATLDSSERNAVHQDKRMVFATPSRTCAYRAQEFSDKEPETLRWVERFGGNGALFDIGANIGSYSIYYGLTHPGSVYAFEPSVFNLRTLVRNINHNGLSSRVHVIPNPLSAKSGMAAFRLASTEEGGALSAFGVDFGYDGKPIKSLVEYQALGWSLDDLMETGLIAERPALVKIDVDGIENLILRGAQRTLKHESCRSVLVEINEALEEESREATEILSSCGFALTEKGQPIGFETTSVNKRLFNQIWVRG